MKIKLDKKDKKIMAELQLDARQTLSSIAKKVKLSKELVRYRIKRLEKLKIIEKYVMVLNATKIGHESFRWYLQLENIDKDKLDELIKYLIENPYCIWVSTSTGRWDLIVVFSAYSPSHFNELIQEFLFRYSKHVREHNFVIALNVYFFKTELFKSYSFENIKTLYWGGSSTRLKLSKIDIRILSEMCKNPSIKISEISKKHKNSFEIVRNHFKKMKNSGLIQGASIILNHKILGFENYKLFFNLRKISPRREKQFLEYLHYHPNVAETIQCIGNWNMEVNIIIKDSNKLYSLMFEIKNKFSDLIKSYSIAQIFKNYKYNLFPMGSELLNNLKQNKLK